MYVERLTLFQDKFYVSSPSQYDGYMILANEDENEYKLYDFDKSSDFANEDISEDFIDEDNGTDLYVVFEKINNSFGTRDFDTDYLIVSGDKIDTDSIAGIDDDDKFHWKLFLALFLPLVFLFILLLFLILVCCLCCRRKKVK